MNAALLSRFERAEATAEEFVDCNFVRIDPRQNAVTITARREQFPQIDGAMQWLGFRKTFYRPMCRMGTARYRLQVDLIIGST